MLDVVGPEELVVIANTGDDCEAYGAHVSPDPDLVTWWLADQIDQRGYGLRGDTFAVMAALEAAGEDTWFRLGDRDLALCLLRTMRMCAGARQTEAHAAVVQGVGVKARVLPASDDPVRTYVSAGGRRRAFQEFMIMDGAKGPIDGVEFEGATKAAPSPEVLEALHAADQIVIGPSNPVASIAPMLAVPGLSQALRDAPAPVVAVSPFVRGEVVKGPTLAFCEAQGISPDASGVAKAYEGIADGLVADERAEGAVSLVRDTLMDNAAARARVAETTLHFAESLTTGTA